MKETCSIVQDLLPLYVDDVCSESSRELVSRHLAECPDCSAVLARMQDHGVDLALEREKAEVISHQRAFFKRKSAAAGLVIAAIFMIPVLVCLIVNLVSNRTLDWFFIVLASLLLAASVIVVPLMAPKDKGLWTFGLGTGSLILLLAVACIYSRGNWFAVATSAVLFGLSVVFLPFVLRSEALKTYVGNRRGLIYMGTITALYAIMLIVIGFYEKAPDFPVIAARVSVPVILFIWMLFGVSRYLKAGPLLKAGICLILIGGLIFVADTLFPALAGEAVEWPSFRPGVWNYTTIDANVRWLTLIITCVIGGILIITNMIRRNKK